VSRLTEEEFKAAVDRLDRRLAALTLSHRELMEQTRRTFAEMTQAVITEAIAALEAFLEETK
jgi:two-component sensor histidine kinase